MADDRGSVVEFAPAKLNLYLHVLGRRADGLHELDSLVAFADIGDRIEAAPAAALDLAVDGGFADQVPLGADNLVLRAATALAAAAGRRPEVALRLTKELPAAAGIGGGSADAAAVLRALVRLWRLDAAALPLDEIAVGLGADVPACLAGRTAFVGGIGERLSPAPPVTGLPVVLVNPGVALATPAVFTARSGPFSAPGRFDAAPGDSAGLIGLLAGRGNDLWPPARRLVPAVDAVVAALAAAPGCGLARMSGSGATCFGLFAEPAAAASAAAALARPGWWVRAGRLL